MPAYIFECNKCNLWGTGQTTNLKKYNYQCYRCHRKEKVMLKKSGTKIRYKGPISPRQATKLVQEINNELYNNYKQKKQELQMTFLI